MEPNALSNLILGENANKETIMLFYVIVGSVILYLMTVVSATFIINMKNNLRWSVHNPRLLAKGYNYFATMEETLFTSPAFKGSSTIRTQVGGALTQALLNGNVEKAMADAEAASNLALTK